MRLLVMNPCSPGERAARSYHAHRPPFHAAVVKRLRDTTDLVAVSTAVDVGCGTGHGAQALATWATRVIAIDTDASMLAAADSNPAITYLHAPAEAIPWQDPVELMTVFSAFHWFDQPAFLAEARRLLAPGGVLAVVNHGMTGDVEGHPGFQAWSRDHLNRHPAIARRGPTMLQNNILDATWDGPVQESTWSEVWWTDREGVASYLMTQGALHAELAAGTDADAVHAGLMSAIAGVLPTGRIGLKMFGQLSWCARC